MFEPEDAGKPEVFLPRDEMTDIERSYRMSWMTWAYAGGVTASPFILLALYEAIITGAPFSVVPGM